MTQDRWDALLDRDWSEAWETLPEAPELVPRAKTAQLTLRLPVNLLSRIKRVAAARRAAVPRSCSLVDHRWSPSGRCTPGAGA